MFRPAERQPTLYTVNPFKRKIESPKEYREKVTRLTSRLVDGGDAVRGLESRFKSVANESHFRVVASPLCGLIFFRILMRPCNAITTIQHTVTHIFEINFGGRKL